ncbi:hypothetical protein [Pseudarthrobacter chlorophenolicus]|uniref:hypothetical protein n=1 Tax=Pseudarthrobacter chlorophenolicus TaxID=85085 RepID=UPI00126A6B7D|nr:hypothetical protein [Pseudarthrobacter chlorophenolicus]
MENALNRFIKSFANVARQSRTGEQVAGLQQLVRHHLRMVAAAQNIHLRRPYVGQLQYLQEQVADLSTVVDCYLEALAAPNMHEAQSHAREAQNLIDAMDSRREVQSKIQSALREISSTDFLDGGGIDLFRALSARHDGLSVAELEDRGRSAFAQLCGRKPEVGTGLSYLIADVFSEAHLDRDRFRSVVQKTALLVANNAEAFDALSGQASLLEDLHEARLRAVQAWVRFQRTVAGRITTPALVKEVLSLYSELFEQVGIPVMGSLLLISGKKTMPYSKLRMQSATSIADSVSRDSVLNGLVEGLDNNLRNAASHGHSYHIAEDSLHIRLKSYQGTLAFDVLTDKTLALMESFTAIQLVLDDELSLRGENGHQVRDLELFGFSVSEIVRLLLTALDVIVHSTVDAGSMWTVTIGPTNRSKLTLAKVISNVLPSNVQTLVLEYDQQSQAHLLRVEVPALAGVSAAQLTDPVKFVQAARSVTVDGTAIFDVNARRRFISHHLMKGLQDGDLTKVAQFRDLRNAAHQWYDPEVDGAINDAIRWLRGVQPEGGLQNYRHRLIRKLENWGQKGDFNLP